MSECNNLRLINCDMTLNSLFKLKKPSCVTNLKTFCKEKQAKISIQKVIIVFLKFMMTEVVNTGGTTNSKI